MKVGSKKSTEVYATAENTPSVKAGYEMGGYLKNPKRANPEHHNTGRRQSPKGQFASKLNWVSMMCLGASGNIQQAIRQSQHDPMWKHIRDGHENELHVKMAEARTLAMQLHGIGEEIARLNGPDKWDTVETPELHKVWGANALAEDVASYGHGNKT